jgi:FKBP-type peptidyl-prolyl cis-trans isomerase
MKNILLTFILFGTSCFAEFTAKPSRPSKPITKPITKPSFDRLSRDDYVYNPYYNDEEIAQEKALKTEKAKMEALEKELNATRRAEQKVLQKKNKAEYDKAMKKFDNRKSTIKTENSIVISDEPIK